MELAIAPAFVAFFPEYSADKHNQRSGTHKGISRRQHGDNRLCPQCQVKHDNAD